VALDEPVEIRIRGVLIELETSSAAMRRLLPEYYSSAKAGEMSNAAISEIGVVIRSLNGALDKIANAIYFRAFGRNGRRTYFPLTVDEATLPALIRRNLDRLQDVDAPMVNVLRQCQPFNEKFAVLAVVKPLYRTHSHLGFELVEMQPSLLIEEAENEPSYLPQGGLTGAAGWEGVAVETRYEQIVGVPGEGRVSLRTDWRFSDLGRSVLGTLLEIHNVTVKVTDLVTSELGFPLTRKNVAAHSLRLMPAHSDIVAADNSDT